MKIKGEALLYDIANLAYVIADTGDYLNHGLHRVTDVCEEGNRDRVARVLGHAYAYAIDALAAVTEPPKIDINRDWSAKVRDYEIKFRKDCGLSPQRKIRIKECVQEYMVTMVLSDWLGFTYPESADIWQEKAAEALASLSATITGRYAFTRRQSPI